MIWKSQPKEDRQIYVYTDDIMGLEARWSGGSTVDLVDTDTGDVVKHTCIYNTVEQVRDLCTALVAIATEQKERGEKIC